MVTDIIECVSPVRVDFLLSEGRRLMSRVKVTLHGCLSVSAEGTTMLLLDDLSALARPHHSEDLGEALAIARNSLRWLSEGETLPDVVVDRLSEKVDDALVTTSAVDGTDVLLGEHTGLLVGLLALLGDKHIVEALNVFLDGTEFLLHCFLVGEHRTQLVEHVLQALHHAGLEIGELLLGSLSVKLIFDLVLVLHIVALVTVEVLPQLSKVSLEIFEQATGDSSTAAAT